MADVIQLRRDTKTNWATINPVLALGEPGLETDTRRVKYGDGITAWNDLPYGGGASTFAELSDDPMDNEELAIILNNKQNVIIDLDSIRSGANKGSTAYQKPSGGIPLSDIAGIAIPDEEDLTSVNAGGTNVLKFKDKAYNQLTYSGMGRVILRKNVVNNANTLTQAMLYQSNTVYIIQYDFTLANEAITIPENCVLKFDGGSLRNGTIDFNNCIIKADHKVFYSILPVQDSVLYQEINPKWFGVVDDGVTINDSALADMGNFVKKIYYYQNTFRNYNSSIPRIVFDFSGIIKIQTPLIFDYPCQVLGFPTFKYVGERTEMGGAIVIDNQYSTVFEINIEGNILDFTDNINFGGILIKRFLYSTFRTEGISKFYSAIISNNTSNSSVASLVKFKLGNIYQIIYGIYCKITNGGWPNGWEISGAKSGGTSDIILPTNLGRCAFLYVNTDGSYNPNHWHIHDNYIEGHKGNTPFHLLAGNFTNLTAYINNNRIENIGGAILYTSANVIAETLLTNSHFNVYFTDNSSGMDNTITISFSDINFNYGDLIAYALGFRSDYALLSEHTFTLKSNEDYLTFPMGFGSLITRRVGCASDYGNRFGVLINLAPNQIIAFRTNKLTDNSLGVQSYTDVDHRTDFNDGIIIRGNFYKWTNASYPSCYIGNSGKVNTGIIKNTTENTLLVFISMSYVVSNKRVPYDISISLWSNQTIDFYRQNDSGYSGMGRKILRKNIVNGTNILTQSMVSQSNTIYIIQYDYDLGGATITLPAGCVLEFDGGSVKNGVISGRNTVINANPVQIFNTDIEFSGTWKIKDVYPEWWGAVGDGVVDCTNSIKQAINCITAMQNIEIYPGEGTPAGCILQFGAGVYLISESGILSSYARRTRGFWLKGISKEATMLKIDDAGNENTMWFFDNESSPVLGTLSKIYIENISFASTNKMCGGFKMRSTGFEKQLKIRNFAFVGKKFLEFYGTGNADLSVIENSSINVYNGGYVITAENAQSVFHRFVNTEISAVEADVVKKNLGGSIYFENCNIETHSAPNSANTTKYFIVRDTGSSVSPSESKISFHCCRFELWNKAGYYKGTDNSYYSSIITFDDCSMFNTDIESTDYQFYIRNNQKVICTNCIMPLRTRVNIGVTSDVATMSLPIFVSTDCDWYRNEMPDVFQMNGDVARIIVRRGASTNAGGYKQTINTFDIDYGYEYLNNYNIPPVLKLFCWPATYISTLRLNGNAKHTQTVNFSSLQKLISIDFNRIGGNVSALFSYHIRWRIYGILRIDDSEILFYDSGSMEKTYADSFSASVLINSNKYKSIKLIQEKEESGWNDGIVGDIGLNISYI